MQNDKEKRDEISKKRKEDKIFNNGYRTGEAMGDSKYEYQSSISVNSNYSENYLRDVYDYEETVEYNIGVEKVFKVIEGDPELSALLYKKDITGKIKLSKEEINWCFNQIIDAIREEKDPESFYSPIYILESLSSILNINSGDPIKDYRKLFDSLDVELQEELLIELNKKYNFLDNKLGKKKMH
jgi:hypothetical protein